MKGSEMKPESPIGYDYCKDCKETKPRDEFPKSATTYCRKCLTIRTKSAPNFRENVRKAQLKKQYGITPSEYDQMELEQNGLCGICKRQEYAPNKKILSVDHNHTTGQVRGLLCHNCNTGLGKFMDDQELLKSAIQYLVSSELKLENDIRNLMLNNMEDK